MGCWRLEDVRLPVHRFSSHYRSSAPIRKGLRTRRRVANQGGLLLAPISGLLFPFGFDLASSDVPRRSLSADARDDQMSIRIDRPGMHEGRCHLRGNERVHEPPRECGSSPPFSVLIGLTEDARRAGTRPNRNVTARESTGESQYPEISGQNETRRVIRRVEHADDQWRRPPREQTSENRGGDCQ